MLIETKLQIPRLKGNSLLRHRLLNELRRNLDRKLVAVVAGAGAGKTTLLAQAVAQFRLPAVYVSLDGAEAELSVFIDYLTTGLARHLSSEGRSSLDRKLAEELTTLNQSAQDRPDPDAAAARLINILARHRAQELYLILDDYHLIPAESPVQRFLDLFIDRMPPVMRFLIASRIAIPLPGIPRWAARQEMIELTASDLALEPDDARSLISACYGANLAPEEFKCLMERTEGWMTGVHLIMQAAGMHKSVKETLNGYIAANRPLFDYFTSEILAFEPPEVRTFLQTISVLDELDPKACDFLVGGRGSASLLADLERRNIFITRNTSGGYRYHPLFKSFLADSIEDRKNLGELHRRAAGFYAAAGDEPAAIDHAILGQDYQRAARLLVGKYKDPTEATQFSRLGRWLRALPERVYQRYPRLLIPKARMLKESGDAAGELAALESAVELLGKRRDRSGLCLALRDLAYRHSQRDTVEAVQMIRKAIRLCPVSRRYIRGDLLHVLANLQVHQGRFNSANDNYAKAIRLMGNNTDYRIAVLGNQAAMQKYRGENLRAIKMYHDLIARVPPNSLEPQAIRIFYAAFLTAIESGYIDQASEFIEQGRHLCQPYWDIITSLLMNEIEAYRDLCRGQLKKAIEKLTAVRDRYQQLHIENRVVGMEIRLVHMRRIAGESEAAMTLMDAISARSRIFERPPAIIDEIKIWFEKGMLDAVCGRTTSARQAAATIARASRKLSYHAGNFFSHLIIAKASRGAGSRRRHFMRALECSHRFGYHGILSLELRADPNLRKLLDTLPASALSVGLIHRLLQQPSPDVAADAAGVIRVRLLGQMELAGPSGKRIDVKWRTRKVQALCAYLLAHRQRFCHREELMDVLWPSLPQDRGKKALYHTAFTLKRNMAEGFNAAGLAGEAYRDPLQHQNQSYRLSPDITFSLDIEELERVRNAAVDLPDGGEKAEAIRAGLTLYRDAFLPSLSDRWCEQQRERYHGMFMFVSEKLGALLLKSGKPEQALSIYLRLLHDEPLADRVRIQCWKAMEQLGRKTDVHGDYEKYVRLLKRTYKEQPSDELRDAYASFT